MECGDGYAERVSEGFVIVSCEVLCVVTLKECWYKLFQGSKRLSLAPTLSSLCRLRCIYHGRPRTSAKSCSDQLLPLPFRHLVSLVLCLHFRLSL